MATVLRFRDPQFDGEAEETSQTIYSRTYRAGPGGTLTEVDLNAGDYLPADDHVAANTAEIVRAWIETVRDGRASRRVVRVIARATNYGA